MAYTTLGHSHHALEKIASTRVIQDTIAATYTSATGVDCTAGSQALVKYEVTHINTLDGSNYFTASFTESATLGGVYTAVPGERVTLSAHSTTSPQPLITVGNEMLVVTIDSTKPFLKVVLTMTGTASVDADVDVMLLNLENIA